MQQLNQNQENVEKTGMFMNIVYLIGIFGMYVGVDGLIGQKYKGKYYLIHGVNNVFISYLTCGDVVNTFTDFRNVLTENVSVLPSIVTVSLHAYHVYCYHKYFKPDDWLHHMLMGLALTLAHQYDTGRLINYSLFFTTGLPGIVDYFLLFLVKNDKLDALSEKKVNALINLWIRAPGCISHSVLTLLVYNLYKDTQLSGYFEQFGYILTALITFWNGIYFMNKVVTSYNTANANK